MNENQTRGAAIPIKVELDKARPKHNYYKGYTPEFQIGWNDKEQTKPHMASGLSFCSTPELAVQAIIDSLMVNCWIDRPEEVTWDGVVTDKTFYRPGAGQAQQAPVVTTKEGLLSRVVEVAKQHSTPPGMPIAIIAPDGIEAKGESRPQQGGEGLLGLLAKKG